MVVLTLVNGPTPDNGMVWTFSAEKPVPENVPTPVLEKPVHEPEVKKPVQEPEVNSESPTVVSYRECVYNRLGRWALIHSMIQCILPS